MIELVKLHHVSFAVSDLAASKFFFSDVIGLPEIERPAFDFAGAWYAIGDRQLHLIEQQGAGKEAAGRITRSDHMALEVKSLDPVRETLDKHGVAYTEGVNQLLGFSQIFCSDPDGHTIELIRPGA